MTKPVRVMQRWDITALAVNGVIGAGIFGLPSTPGGLLGAASPIAFLLCALIVYVLVLCFAGVARHFSETGGPYLYARAAFGMFIGFEVGWSTWLARLAAFAGNSNVLISYLGFLAPWARGATARAAIIFVIIGAIAAVNIRGVRGSARFSDAFAAAKTLGLALFVLIGLFFVNWPVFSAAHVPSHADWPGALMLLIYAYTGFEAAVIPAAEAQDPKRDIGWSLILGLGIAAVLYLGVQVVAVGTAPGLASSQQPLADAGRNFLGPIAGGAIALLACVSIIGNLGNIALVNTRMTYAFAQNGDFPRFFGTLHPRFATPVGSIVFFSLAAAILAISGTFALLVKVSVLARLVSYLATCLSLPKFDKRPLAIAGSITGSALCVWLLLQTPARDVLSFAAACAAGGMLYLISSTRYRRRVTRGA